MPTVPGPGPGAWLRGRTSAVHGRGASSKRRERHAEDRAGGRAQRLRPGRVGAARGERDAGAERVGRAQQRADVARVADVPERERQRPRAVRQVCAAVDADHARRVRERRELGDERRLDVLAGDEQVDRLDAGSARGLDEILALADEQPLLLALPPRLEQPPDQLQLRVVRGRDQNE